MICPEYFDMSIVERYNFIGKAIHLIQSDPQSHKSMSSMIRAAEQNGLFDEVKILPQDKIDNYSSEIFD